jgi:hypothetical protein
LVAPQPKRAAPSEPSFSRDKVFFFVGRFCKTVFYKNGTGFESSYTFLADFYQHLSVKFAEIEQEAKNI